MTDVTAVAIRDPRKEQAAAVPQRDAPGDAVPEISRDGTLKKKEHPFVKRARRLAREVILPR